MRTALAALADLIWPAVCAGCSTPGPALCTQCRLAFSGPVRRCEGGAARLDYMGTEPALPVWTTASYEDRVAVAILAAKNGGHWRVVKDLAATVEQVAFQIAPSFDFTGPKRRAESAPRTAPAAKRDSAPAAPASPEVHAVPSLLEQPLAVIPMPSAVRIAQRRMFTEVLAEAVVTGLTYGGCVAELRHIFRSATHHQVGRSARSRGSRTLTPRPGARLDQPALLVDDVLTTGATLAAAARGVRELGSAALGAIVLAASPAPSSVLRTGKVHDVGRE